jgi:hypothetical protein
MTAGDLCPPRHLEGGEHVCVQAVLSEDPAARQGAREASIRGAWCFICWGCLETLEIAVSEESALRRVQEEIAQLESERVRLSTDVMEGRPGALEEDEQLRHRLAELGGWLLEAEKESGEGGGAA